MAVATLRILSLFCRFLVVHAGVCWDPLGFHPDIINVTTALVASLAILPLPVIWLLCLSSCPWFTPVFKVVFPLPLFVPVATCWSPILLLGPISCAGYESCVLLPFITKVSVTKCILLYNTHFDHQVLLTPHESVFLCIPHITQRYQRRLKEKPELLYR